MVKNTVEVIAVNYLGIVRILGSLKIEELESIFDEIKNIEKLIRKEEPNDDLLTQRA